MLYSVAEIIDAVGGPSAACELAGIKSANAPSNWKARRKIPSEHFLVFTDALRAVGKEADPAVFGLTVPAA
jgi:DNA-binding transcriptional regulator YdaS (Cro superfamily)